jgi:hypothetical protein
LFSAIRATRQYCSTRCRVPGHRSRIYARRLRDCRIELIGRSEARELIMRHEALGSCGNATLWFGLRDPRGRLLSVIGFGPGPHAAGGCITLERGHTRRRAPPNAPSFLITRALRFGARVLGWSTVKAFSDRRYGERGTVLAAAGFKRSPPSRHGSKFRYALVDGDRVLSDRAIYRRYGSMPAARAANVIIIRVPARQAWLWQRGA